MSQAETARAEQATVASCAASECRHNENSACHASEVRMDVGSDGRAVCGTYEPATPKARP